MPVPHTLARTARLRAADCDLDEFVALVGQRTDLADYPLADRGGRPGVLVYDADRLRSSRATDDGRRRRRRPSWCAALTDGPGVVVVPRAPSPTRRSSTARPRRSTR